MTDHKHIVFLFLIFLIKSIDVESRKSEVSGSPLKARPITNIFDFLISFPIFFSEFFIFLKINTLLLFHLLFLEFSNKEFLIFN